jgi:hypothetical protein
MIGSFSCISSSVKPKQPHLQASAGVFEITPCANIHSSAIDGLFALVRPKLGSRSKKPKSLLRVEQSTERFENGRKRAALAGEI